MAIEKYIIDKSDLTACEIIELPKGHGRLIDADYKASSDGMIVNSVCGYIAPTIIEADRSEEHG